MAGSKFNKIANDYVEILWDSSDIYAAGTSGAVHECVHLRDGPTAVLRCGAPDRSWGSLRVRARLNESRVAGR
jgi:hypothetical protein